MRSLSANVNCILVQMFVQYGEMWSLYRGSFAKSSLFGCDHAKIGSFAKVNFSFTLILQICKTITKIVIVYALYRMKLMIC